MAGSRLSIRRLQPDPWNSTVADLKVGDVIEGTVTKIVNFGAFVRVREGLEGLIHISELSHQRVAHPGDVVHEGQRIKLKVISLDSERHRLGLSLKQAEEAPPRPAAEPRGERRPRPERGYDMAQAVQEPEGGIDNTLAAAFAQVRQQVAEQESQRRQGRAHRDRGRRGDGGRRGRRSRPRSLRSRLMRPIVEAIVRRGDRRGGGRRGEAVAEEIAEEAVAEAAADARGRRGRGDRRAEAVAEAFVADESAEEAVAEAFVAEEIAEEAVAEAVVEAAPRSVVEAIVAEEVAVAEEAVAEARRGRGQRLTARVNPTHLDIEGPSVA